MRALIVTAASVLCPLGYRHRHRHRTLACPDRQARAHTSIFNCGNIMVDSHR